MVHDEDAELLRELQRQHGDALFVHALRLTHGDRQRAEDLVQETLLRAWQQADRLDPKHGPVRPWLFTIVRNLAIDAWRRGWARSSPTNCPRHCPKWTKPTVRSKRGR